MEEEEQEEEEEEMEGNTTARARDSIHGHELDALTGQPLPTDVLLYALPVCGPVGALAGFKYRVKVTPGQMKKGKGERRVTSALLMKFRCTDTVACCCHDCKTQVYSCPVQR